MLIHVSVDLCKWYERLAITFKEKLARLSGKINNTQYSRHKN